MPSARPRARRDPRSAIRRRTIELNGTIGRQIVDLRTDIGVSQCRLAEAAGIPQSYTSAIEHGRADPSLAVLVAIADALGADVSVRLNPTTGPRIRDRIQAPIVEELIRTSRSGWKAL